MKNILLSSFSILLITTFSYGKYTPKENEKEVVNRAGIFYEKFSNIPYTGKGIFIEENRLVKLTLKKGQLNGTTFVYDKNSGILNSEITFKNGVKNGIYKTFNNKGNLTSNIEYINGLPCNGWSKELNQDLRYKDCKKSGIEKDYKSHKWVKIYWKNSINIKEEPK